MCMNIVRLLREQLGLTQQALAEKAGTSQPTIALYESGSKSPTLATLQRLASSLGFELAVTLTPRLTREDHRSLAYHRAIARILRQNPLPTLKRAKQMLARMKKQHPQASHLFDQWSEWLELPTQALVSKLLDPGLLARDMRQVSPFAGVLRASERVKILSQFRRDYNEAKRV